MAVSKTASRAEQAARRSLARRQQNREAVVAAMSRGPSYWYLVYFRALFVADEDNLMSWRVAWF